MARGWKATSIGVMPGIIGALLTAVPGTRASAAEPLALTIDNMHEKSVVHSGFVVGTASEASGTSGVQKDRDGGPFLEDAGLAKWEFQLPIGTATWRGSSAHTEAART